MSKIIIPQSNITLGEDPNVDISCKVIIKLHWKNKIVQPEIESLRNQIQQAFNQQAKLIEEDLIKGIKGKKSPGFTKEGNNEN